MNVAALVHHNAAVAQEVLRKAAELNRQLALKRTSPVENVALIFCFYCDVDFADEERLLQHQKEKHFRCAVCSVQVDSSQIFRQHYSDEHKQVLKAIPNSLPNRRAAGIDIMGMKGVPVYVLNQRKQKLKNPSSTTTTFVAPTAPPLTPAGWALPINNNFAASLLMPSPFAPLLSHPLLTPHVALTPPTTVAPTTTTATTTTTAVSTTAAKAKPGKKDRVSRFAALQPPPAVQKTEEVLDPRLEVRVKLFVGEFIHRAVLKSARFELLHEVMCSRLAPHSKFLVKYEDDEKDLILITTTRDLTEAMTVQKISPGSSGTLKLIVTPVVDDDVVEVPPPASTTATATSNSQNQSSSSNNTSSNNNNRSSSVSGGEVYQQPNDLYFEAPPAASSSPLSMNTTHFMSHYTNKPSSPTVAPSYDTHEPLPHWALESETYRNNANGIYEDNVIVDVRDLPEFANKLNGYNNHIVDVREMTSPSSHSIDLTLRAFEADATRVLGFYNLDRLDFLKQVAENVVHQSDDRARRLSSSAVSAIRSYSGILELLLEAGWVYDDLKDEVEFAVGSDLSKMKILLDLFTDSAKHNRDRDDKRYSRRSRSSSRANSPSNAGRKPREESTHSRREKGSRRDKSPTSTATERSKSIKKGLSPVTERTKPAREVFLPPERSSSARQVVLPPDQPTPLPLQQRREATTQRNRSPPTTQRQRSPFTAKDTKRQRSPLSRRRSKSKLRSPARRSRSPARRPRSPKDNKRQRSPFSTTHDQRKRRR